MNWLKNLTIGLLQLIAVLALLVGVGKGMFFLAGFALILFVLTSALQDT